MAILGNGPTGRCRSERIESRESRIEVRGSERQERRVESDSFQDEVRHTRSPVSRRAGLVASG